MASMNWKGATAKENASSYTGNGQYIVATKKAVSNFKASLAAFKSGQY